MVVPVVPLSQTRTEADELRSFVYNMGFLRAAWSDTLLNIGNLPTLRLHALFVSQSPVLYHHLSSQAPNQGQYHINLNSEDPALTAPAVSTALATLYGHPMDIQGCDFATARGMLAAGSLFGLEKIASQAYDLLLKSLTRDLLPTFFELALSPSFVEGDNSVDKGPYPPYTENLLQHLIEYIYENFKEDEVDATWISALSSLPFTLYKQVVESPNLKFQSARDRYTFAQRIAKKRRAGDEQVLLAFGNGTQGVQVVRRQKNADSQRQK